MTSMWRKLSIQRKLILSMRERVTSEELPAQLGGLRAALRQAGAARQGATA